MADNEIAKAYITIQVNNKQVQQQFQQTRQKLNQNANQISSNFNKSFRSITSAARRTANQVSAMLKVAMTPMIAGGGLAIKKFMSSEGGENARRQWATVKKGLDEALERLGKMLWQSTYFGKSIEGWTKALTEFLNKLRPQDIERMVSAFENMGKALAGLKIGSWVAGLAGTIASLIAAINSAKSLTGMKLRMESMAATQSATTSTLMFGNAGQRKASEVLAVQKASAVEKFEKGGILAPLGGFKAITGFLKLASAIVVLIIAAMGSFAAVFKRFGVEIKDLGDFMTKTFKVLKVTFEVLVGMIKIAAISVYRMGELATNLFIDFQKNKYLSMVGKGNMFGDMKKSIENYRDSILKDYNSVFDVTKLEDPTKIRQEMQDRINMDAEPKSKKLVEGFQKIYDGIIDSQAQAIEEFKKRRQELTMTMKSTDPIKQDEVRQQLELMDAEWDRITQKTKEKLEDFMAAMEIAIDSDKILKDSKALGYFKQYMDNMNRMRERDVERQGKMNAKLGPIQQEYADKAMTKFKVERDIKDNQAEMVKDLAKLKEKFIVDRNNLRADLGKGLGFSGETMGVADLASFNQKVSFDWQNKLLEYQQESLNLNKEWRSEDKETRDKYNSEIKKLNDNLEEAIRLWNLAVGWDTAKGVAGV